MPRFGVSRVLPYQPEQLFDLAADVEHYPAFLPWWQSAAVVSRDAAGYDTDQIVGFGPIRQRFRSRTVLHRPDRIEVSAVEGPFKLFKLTWRFEPLPHERCEVALDGEIDLRSPLLGGLLGRVMDEGVGTILSAFEDRARRLYGSPSR